MEFLDIQYGDNLITSNGILFRNPTVQDARGLGEKVYLWFMYIWMEKPQDVIHFLRKNNIEFDRIIHEELIAMRIKNDKDLFIKVLKYFTNIEFADLIYSQEEEFECLNCTIVDKKGNRQSVVIGYETIQEIYEFLKNVHFFKHKEPRRIDNIETRHKILDYEIEEMESESKKLNNYSQLQNIISTIVTCNKRTWDYVYGLTINRLFDEYYRILKVKQADYINIGIHTGKIDSKKIKTSEIDFAGNLL